MDEIRDDQRNEQFPAFFGGNRVLCRHPVEEDRKQGSKDQPPPFLVSFSGRLRDPVGRILMRLLILIFALLMVVSTTSWIVGQSDEGPAEPVAAAWAQASR